MRFLNTHAPVAPAAAPFDLTDVEAGLRSLQAHCLTSLSQPSTPRSNGWPT